MRTVEAVRYKQRLDYLFDKVSVFSDQIEIQSHWARYLCVLISGFIETGVCAIYSRYTQEKAAPCVANYVCSKLNRFRNPNMEDICQLTGLFNARWREKLERATAAEQKDAVDSIVANRNQIAHGANVGISYASVKQYYDRVVEVVELVEDIVLEGL
jgi:hypothetical protein